MKKPQFAVLMPHNPAIPSPVPCFKIQYFEGCPMPDTYLNNRPVYFGDVYLKGCDSYFENAHYADDDTELDENDLYELDQQCADYLVECCIEKFGYFND